MCIAVSWEILIQAETFKHRNLLNRIIEVFRSLLVHLDHFFKFSEQRGILFNTSLFHKTVSIDRAVKSDPGTGEAISIRWIVGPGPF